MVPPARAAGATSRRYWLHVPAGYDPRRPVPLVLGFHGAGGTGLGFEALSGLSVLADRLGFLVAYPQGIHNPDGSGVGWAASGPADPDADGVDDGLYVSLLLNQVEADYCVDTSRVGATGFSNGAGLTGYLACALAGRVAAVAPVEGEFFQITGGCAPAEPVSVLDVHVLTDPVAPYPGTPPRGSPDYYASAIPDWVQSWARRDGCGNGPVTVSASNAQTDQTWSGCDRGTAVEAYRVATGGHTWPVSLGSSVGSMVIARFLVDHPRRPSTIPWAAHDTASSPTPTPPLLPILSTTRYQLATADAEPVDVASGLGYIWFTEFHSDKIGRIAPNGHLEEYAVPTPGAEPYQIAAGPDRAMWFTEYNTTKVGRVTADGHITELQPTATSEGGLGVAAGSAVWIADPADTLDRIQPGPAVTSYRLRAGDGTPFAIAAATSGEWVSRFTGFFDHTGTLDHLLPDGRITPLSLGPASNIDALTTDHHGNLWLADFETNRIGELRPTGLLTWIPFPTPYAGLNDLTTDLDGAVWCSTQDGLVGRLGPDGHLLEAALPAGSQPDGIATTSSTTAWVAATGIDAIIKVTIG